MALLTESWKIDTLALLIGAITVIYLLLKRNYSYWDRKGIKTLEGFNYVFGHFKGTFVDKQSIADSITNMYKSTNEPFEGVYGIFRRMLLARDPELIRNILIKDFSNFTDRGIHCNEEYDPLSGNLFSLPGQKWKNLREKLTPTFTSGKLKATKATNVIASVAFGIDVDTIQNPNNDFRVCGRTMFETSFWNALRGLIGFIQPNLMSMLRLKSVDESVEKFIMSVVKQNLEYREQNNVSRKDFFQLLIHLRNNGTNANESQKKMSINEIAAQTSVFFAAGFETSSTTLSFCLYELAKNQDILRRVHEEIDEVLERHNEQITYESISDMKYLEACIDETLRKYPVVPLLLRTCINDYQIPGTDKIIEKGTEMMIPAFALQRDEKYYEEPEKFKPERFNEENSMGKNLVNRPYLPFGDGPRNCIGMRFGKMQTKVGLVLMLQHFKYELEDRLKQNELEFDSNSFILAPLGGIKLHVLKRKL